MMSSGRIAQHRNYGELMARHEKEIKIKRVIRVFIYFLIITFVVMLFFLIRRIEQKHEIKIDKPSTATVIAIPHGS